MKTISYKIKDQLSVKIVNISAKFSLIQLKTIQKIVDPVWEQSLIKFIICGDLEKKIKVFSKKSDKDT